MNYDKSFRTPFYLIIPDNSSSIIEWLDEWAKVNLKGGLKLITYNQRKRGIFYDNMFRGSWEAIPVNKTLLEKNRENLSVPGREEQLALTGLALRLLDESKLEEGCFFIGEEAYQPEFSVRDDQGKIIRTAPDFAKRLLREISQKYGLAMPEEVWKDDNLKIKAKARKKPGPQYDEEDKKREFNAYFQKATKFKTDAEVAKDLGITHNELSRRRSKWKKKGWLDESTELKIKSIRSTTLD